jgi:hypothetical protein
MGITVVPNPMDEYNKIMVKWKKDEVVGIMMTYISRVIYFHTCGIDYMNEVHKTLKNLFDKVDEI